MISRSALTRGSQAALRSRVPKLSQRGFAAATAGGPTTASYEQFNVAGVKVASRDDNGPITRLAVVARAGTRYEPLPGLAVGLQEFAFKNTLKRSALRITRESELLGSQLNAYHTREGLVIQADFLREHLPYFTELLAEVITQTKYTTFEFHEQVEQTIGLKQKKLGAADVALDAAHAVAFHNGLGAPLYPSAAAPIGKYADEHSIAAFAEAAYTKSNIAVVGDGASQAGLSKWVEPFFKGVPESSAKQLSSATSKYYGGEQRVAHQGPNSMVIGFSGSSLSANAPEVDVLVALLGGASSIKWSPGFTLLSKAASGAPGVQIRARNYAYSDAGFLAIEINGGAEGVRKAAEESVKALQSITEGSVSKEDLTKAIAKAKFDLLAGSELSGTGLVHAGANLIHGGKPLQVLDTIKALEAVSAEKVKSAAKSLLESKATVAAVGDLFVLPYAEALGLKV